MPSPPNRLAPEGLGRVLGPLRGLALSLGVVVGAGIFVLPAAVGELLPSPLPFVSVWIVGGFIALCTGFCYAELATAFPRTGGYVVYLRETYGDRLAFVYGWAALGVLYPASIAGLGRVFGGTLQDLLALERGEVLFAVLVIGSATLVNVAGVVLSARLQILLTGVKVAALVSLTTAGLVRSGPGPGPSFGEAGLPMTAFDLSAWALALVTVSWCFDGFLEIVTVAGEVRRPARTLTRVLIATVLLVTVVYVGLALALLRQLSMGEIAGATTVTADLARRLVGEGGSALIKVAVLWASGSVIVSLLLSGPRIVVGLAEAGLFFPVAGRIWRRTRTPAVAVLLMGVVSVVYAGLATFLELVKFFQFATGLFSALIVAGGWWLRQRGRIPRDRQRIPIWPLPPLVAGLASLGAVGFVLNDQPRSSLVGLALMLLALPLSGRISGRPSRPAVTRDRQGDG